MAYFIVIGTNNDMKGVVDEVKRAHLQHNVITSGCILSNDDGMYYHWDVYNEKGDKTKENIEPIALHDALTNQISQFKTLIPDDAISNVFIVSQCFEEDESETLQMVCEELYSIGGAILSGLMVDIVLVGYDINKPEDVTLRPHWRLLESLQGLGVGGRFKTDILYVNNMDYMGAATNIDSRIFAKFLCQWSKVVCSGECDPKATVNSRVYSIGISEHQYDFRDLNDFFKLSAEERLLERTLNASPSHDTAVLISSNYFKKIDLDAPWIDGLCRLKDIWKEYCEREWDFLKPLSETQYSISRQEQTIASYLNSYLKLYVSEERREIENLSLAIKRKESEKSALIKELEELNALHDDGNDDGRKEDQANSIKESIERRDSDISELSIQIKKHEANIHGKEFNDADTFYADFGGKALLTEEYEAGCTVAKADIDRLFEYVKSEEGISVMREAVERATVDDTLPEPYPASEVMNIGCVKAIEPTPEQIPSMPLSQPRVENPYAEELDKRSGCLFWFKSLFKNNKIKESEVDVSSVVSSERPESIQGDAMKFLYDTLDRSVAALRKADEVHAWWRHLCAMIDGYQKRQAECKLKMDGEKDINGRYLSGKEGYRPESHRKSVSLIDMDMVRGFRDTDKFYGVTIDRFLNRWFDRSIPSKDRMTIPELIKHQVLDPLVGKFHTLLWNGQNPFVKEIITDEQMHEIIESDIKQSKPFVEYVLIQDSNLSSNLNIYFFSNNGDIPTKADEFRKRYNLGASSLLPVYLKDFVNSLCVVQVMAVPDHIDALKDFKPKRIARLSRFRLDIKNDVATIVGNAKSAEEKALAIYNWLCENIAYDTTKQIHDAETCYKTRRGVCQAYSELFCRMAEAVGLTADIIEGKTKNSKGAVLDSKHAWIFVYTNGYDGMLIDPSWGAGELDGLTFVKNTDNSTWFNVSPCWMVFSHYPDEQYWTKLEIKITEEQFRKLPYVCPQRESNGEDYLFECLSKIS